MKFETRAKTKQIETKEYVMILTQEDHAAFLEFLNKEFGKASYAGTNPEKVNYLVMMTSANRQLTFGIEIE